MAEDNVYKQEFIIRHFSTSSVTFFPARANIVRDIKDVILKPGANEITIYGLTPTADENSIKVDGKGSATITDMMVELVPNRDRYEDVYPSDSGEEDDTEESQSEDEPDHVESLQKEEEKIGETIKKAQEEKASASGRLNILENVGKSVEKDRPKDIAGCLSMYEEERRKAFEVFHTSEIEINDLMKQKKEVAKRRRKATDRASKAKAKASQAMQKEKDRKKREQEKKTQAKRQLKVDRIKFWPKKVYKVVVCLDSMSELTPASSRRGSVSSLPKTTFESDVSHIALSVSYITSSASWAPRYDLSLHTPTSSGSIMYRAEFSNSTSEVWKDAKVTLSTSQTAFQGLGEAIPQLQPWRIDLAKSTSGGNSGVGPLHSNHEQQYKNSNIFGNTQKHEPPRDTLFGLENLDVQMQQMLHQQQARSLQMLQRQQKWMSNDNNSNNNNNKPIPQSSLFGSNNNFQAQQQQMVMNQAPAPSGGLFGNSSTSNTGAFGSSAFQRSRGAAAPAAGAFRVGGPPLSDEDHVDIDAYFGGDAETIIPDLPALDTLESSWSESGLTANYEIPGLRTISPSFTLRRHRIASLNLKDIHLSHLLVPKLRAAAFLKARIRNSSSIALLRGPVGVTLDGSFLGNATLPRSSAGESFSLSLGVDPSVTVVYGKPTVRKSQSGFLSKESSSIYTRTCMITNTKPNLAIEGLFLDQVPVSNDERLQVEVLQPRGLRREGDSVRSGSGVPTAGKDDPKWGKAAAVFKKAGEVCFDFKIEGGKGARFVVEYETKHPSMEQVISA